MNGRVWLLDMGKPVRIDNLVRDLSSLRPGAKLFKEWLCDLDATVPTRNRALRDTKLGNTSQGIAELLAWAGSSELVGETLAVVQERLLAINVVYGTPAAAAL